MTLQIEDIPIDKTKVQKHNVRTQNINEGVEELAESIKANGLLQPIAAYFDSKDDCYVILAGQRRLNAYHQLNETYPGEGFDKIACIMIDEPDSDESKISMSLAENITQLQMSNPDLIKAVTDLYNVYGDYEMVRLKFGLTQKVVEKYVRIERLPELLKDAVKNGEISPNPKRAQDIAVRAVDALNFTPSGSVTEQQVLELAHEMAKGETSMIDIASEAVKGGTTSEIVERAKKKPKEKLNIHLNTDTAEKLKAIADSNDESEGLRATQYVVDGVEKDYKQL